MYLKRIEVIGFKSFADKLNIDFGPGITTVVGPNGSGKSNIVDAVRWVLGEQSVKQLRGATQMVDVIFSGSQTRKPQSYASVTLVLDNSDQYLPVEYTEVAITRRVYRDGDSEYLINKDKCRLKDITELILDTGLGRDSFSIISQGKVQEILSSKPEERRKIFEEAAGVLKYRKRKERAFRKLERTEENMNRAKDIISELERNIKPLKRQAEKAKKYNEKHEQLQEIEVSVSVYDINKHNQKFNALKHELQGIETQLIEAQTTVFKEENILTEKKQTLQEMDDEINKLQDELVKTSTLVEKLNGQKQVMAERRKYAKDHEEEFKTNALKLKEEALKLNAEMDKLKYEVQSKTKELTDLKEMIKTLESNASASITTRREMEQDIQKSIRLVEELSTRTNALESSLSSYSNVNYAVKQVLENKSLSGVHDVIGNVIKTEKEYTTAIETALGNAAQFVITDTQEDAKACVNYLKKEKAGRATFFPISVIEGRYIHGEEKNVCESYDEFVGYANTLVECDEKFQTIIDNQLGNIIIVKTLDGANELSLKINKKFKIVTLTGEVVNIGGSISGGRNKRGNRGIVAQRQELEDGLAQLSIVEENLAKLKTESNELSETIKDFEENLYNKRVERVELEELISSKLSALNGLEETQKSKEEEQTHLEEILNNLSEEDEEVTLLNQLYEVQSKRDQLTREVQDFRKTRLKYTEEIEIHDQNIKALNKQGQQLQKENNRISTDMTRLEVELENLLERLNEYYKLTFEAASEIARNDLDFEMSRIQVKTLKAEIERLGFVNHEAIEQFEEANERYESLTSQISDLTEAKMTLLDTIKELDEVMKDRFEETFHQVQSQFTNVFRHLFGGGNAELQLTDPDNLLESGVDIIAQPPGKKLQHLSLMSGGEKALTAISLLFAMLRIRTIPFVILDEVEAALDEANVARYADYLHKYSNKTQFIVITHRKGTMEKSDVLYGVTMQNDGVSNLVSVKLEDVHHYVDEHQKQS